MKTYLVTGGAGFIGSHLVEALVSKGKVKVLDNLCTGALENLDSVKNEVEWIEGSVEDVGLLSKVMRGVEVVFHEAAIASVPSSFEDPLGTHATNLTGTLNVLWAAKQCGVKRVVYASSAAVYGNMARSLQSELNTPHPLSPYAIHKHASEQYAQLFSAQFGLETVGLRYFNVFGPRQDPRSSYSGVISKFIEQMTQGKVPVIFGDGQQTRDFVYVKDVVAANLLAAEAAPAIFFIRVLVLKRLSSGWVINQSILWKRG